MIGPHWTAQRRLAQRSIDSTLAHHQRGAPGFTNLAREPSKTVGGVPEAGIEPFRWKAASCCRIAGFSKTTSGSPRSANVSADDHIEHSSLMRVTRVIVLFVPRTRYRSAVRQDGGVRS